jgi:PTS system fructose-specific IIC component
MLIYPLGGILIIGAVMCGINPVMGMINTAMTNCLNAMGGTSKVLLGAIVAGMMSIDMGGPFNKAAYVFGTAALASGNYEVMAAVMVGGMVPPIAIALSMTFGCALRAPHGGIFVFPVVDHALLYCVALAAGSVVGAVILSLLKKNRTDAV